MSSIRLCFALLGVLIPSQFGFLEWNSATAADGLPIYKIEEDWSLVVLEPDPAIHCPQVTLFTFPLGDSQSKYFQLQLNHAADEWFSGGGFQVAAVAQEEVVDRARSEVRTPLATNGDTIQWTVVMACINNEFLYAVKNGTSASWGSFGGPDYLVRMPSGDTTSLSGYSYHNSLNGLDVGFGANRVESLKLVRVRLYDTGGGIHTIDVNQSY